MEELFGVSMSTIMLVVVAIFVPCIVVVAAFRSAQPHHAQAGAAQPATPLVRVGKRAGAYEPAECLTGPHAAPTDGRAVDVRQQTRRRAFGDQCLEPLAAGRRRGPPQLGRAETPDHAPASAPGAVGTEDAEQVVPPIGRGGTHFNRGREWVSSRWAGAVTVGLMGRARQERLPRLRWSGASIHPEGRAEEDVTTRETTRGERADGSAALDNCRRTPPTPLSGRRRPPAVLRGR